MIQCIHILYEVRYILGIADVGSTLLNPQCFFYPISSYIPYHIAFILGKHTCGYTGAWMQELLFWHHWLTMLNPNKNQSCTQIHCSLHKMLILNNVLVSTTVLMLKRSLIVMLFSSCFSSPEFTWIFREKI